MKPEQKAAPALAKRMNRNGGTRTLPRKSVSVCPPRGYGVRFVAVSERAQRSRKNVPICTAQPGKDYPDGLSAAILQALSLSRNASVSHTRFRKLLFGAGLFCSAHLASAEPVIIKWQDVGGQDSFERQGVTFTPKKVDSFIAFSSDGHWENLVGTENSLLRAIIFLRIGGIWTQLAQDDSVRGPFRSTSPLDNFTFSEIDFSAGLLDGISITNSGAGASRYAAMNSVGAGTVFTFAVNDVPVPSSPWLLGVALLAAALQSRRKDCRSRDGRNGTCGKR